MNTGEYGGVNIDEHGVNSRDHSAEACGSASLAHVVKIQVNETLSHIKS